MFVLHARRRPCRTRAKRNSGTTWYAVVRPCVACRPFCPAHVFGWRQPILLLHAACTANLATHIEPPCAPRRRRPCRTLTKKYGAGWSSYIASIFNLCMLTCIRACASAGHACIDRPASLVHAYGDVYPLPPAAARSDPLHVFLHARTTSISPPPHSIVRARLRPLSFLTHRENRYTYRRARASMDRYTRVPR